MTRFISLGKTLILVFVSVFSFQCLSAQDSDTLNTDSVYQGIDTVDSAYVYQNIDSVESDYVYAMLSSPHFNKTIIDGRDSVMFHSGHLENALSIDAFSSDLHQSLQRHLTEDTLIVHCTINNRASIIIENLKLLNYEGLIIFMQDGFKGWEENEFDITTPSESNE